MSELLNLDDIAERWKVEREYARRYLVKKPGFPAPVPGSGRKTRRWLAKDIEEFLSDEKEHA